MKKDFIDKIGDNIKNRANEKKYDIDRLISIYLNDYKNKAKSYSLTNKSILTYDEYLKLVEKLVNFCLTRYSDSEINKIYPISNSKYNMDDMIRHNGNLNKHMETYSDQDKLLIQNFLNKISWKEIYIRDFFMNSLSRREQVYFDDPNFKNDMLNLTMYMLINQDRIVGPRRAYLFAKEFKLNKDIPMMYGINENDKHLRQFINEYLKDGGNKELTCITNYGDKDKYLLNFATIEKILTFTDDYTDEELNLYSKLAESLNKLKDVKEENELKENIKKAYQYKKSKSIDNNNK